MTTLHIIENILVCHDKELIQHFDNCGIGADIYCWMMLKNLFTEVLTADHWMKVFDHLFTMPTAFLYYYTVAYIMYFRTSLLQLHNREDFQVS
jgi:hypothetical protein